MAKIKETIGNAVLEVDADEAGCIAACRAFHVIVAEHQLREVERQLARLKPLQRNRRELVALIAKLRRQEEGDLMRSSS